MLVEVMMNSTSDERLSVLVSSRDEVSLLVCPSKIATLCELKIMRQVSLSLPLPLASSLAAADESLSTLP